MLTGALQIERIELFEVPLTLRTPLRSSTHVTHDISRVLVKLTASGLIGWGEIATLNDASYLGETTGLAWHAARELFAPALRRAEFRDVAAFCARYAHVREHTFTRAGFELAAWDVIGKATGRSLGQMLGAVQARIPCGVVVGVGEAAATLEAVARYVDEGYGRIKLKVGAGRAMAREVADARDVATVTAVRQQFPDMMLWVDANSAYAIEDLDVLCSFDALGVGLLEQPFAVDDLLDHAALQRRVRAKVCLDESVRSLHDARSASALGAARSFNVKPGRVGGLCAARELASWAARAGIETWCGGMFEFGIGRAANIALAACPWFTAPGDISASDKYFTEDVIESPARLEEGHLRVPSAPGLGVEVREAWVRERALRTDCVS